MNDYLPRLVHVEMRRKLARFRLHLSIVIAADLILLVTAIWGNV